MSEELAPKESEAKAPKAQKSARVKIMSMRRGDIVYGKSDNGSALVLRHLDVVEMPKDIADQLMLMHPKELKLV